MFESTQPRLLVLWCPDWPVHAHARESPALLVRGILERSTEGVTNLLADAFEPLSAGVLHRSRDFH